MISTLLPWSTNTFFTLYLPILRVITRALSYDCKVPTLSSLEKLNAGQTSILLLFGSRLEFWTSGGATNITLEGWELILARVARITLIMPKGSLEVVSFWDPNPAWLSYPLGWYKNCFNFPLLTSYSKWLHKVLQSFVVRPRSWWYWQWRLWLLFVGSPPILFGHLKYGSIFIFSKTWCTSSWNTMLTTWVTVNLDCLAKSLRWWLLLYLSDLKSLLSFTLAFPFPCYWSSLTHLYLSILSMSSRTLLASFLVNDFLKSCSVGRPTLKVLIATLLREEIDDSEWNVGKPNRDSTIGSWNDTHRLSMWCQAYPNKKKQELHLTKQQQRPNKKYITILN